MPADALRGLAAPMGVASAFTLTFGAYAEPSFIGMKATVRRSAPVVDGAGNVSQVLWNATVAADGTASVGPLPYCDDGATYTVEWQALSYKDTPGNKVFQVLSSSGLTTVDFDTLQQVSPALPVAVPVDAVIAALLRDPTSQTYQAAAHLPSYVTGA